MAGRIEDSISRMFFFLRFFFMWAIFKVFIEFVTIMFLFCVLFFFGHEACGILVPQLGIQPISPFIEVLTTEPPGKSLNILI